jgi:hypothetical protein
MSHLAADANAVLGSATAGAGERVEAPPALFRSTSLMLRSSTRDTRSSPANPLRQRPTVERCFRGVSGAWRPRRTAPGLLLHQCFRQIGAVEG